MKIFLDDERQTPTDWQRTYTANETIELLKGGEVTHLSLDPEAGTGYDVLVWIEKMVHEHAFNFDKPFIPPIMTIHSANPVGRQRMTLAIQMIYHQFKITQPVLWDEFREKL